METIWRTVEGTVHRHATRIAMIFELLVASAVLLGKHHFHILSVRALR